MRLSEMDVPTAAKMLLAYCKGDYVKTMDIVKRDYLRYDWTDLEKSFILEILSYLVEYYPKSTGIDFDLKELM